VHEGVGIIGAKTRGIGQRNDDVSLPRGQATGKRSRVTTPHVGGAGQRSGGATPRRYAVSASTWAIGRFPHRLRVAKSSNRSMYSPSGEARMPSGSSRARVASDSNTVPIEK
jgi:hypothetical protein